MSRRYGRNQKRRHREEQAALTREIARLTAVASDHWTRMASERAQRLAVERELVEWAADIVNLLGPESAFAREMHAEAVDARLFEAVAVRGGPYQAAVDTPLDRLGPTTELATIGMARKVVRLFATYAGMETDGAALRRRFIIVDPSGAQAILMDERTLYLMRKHGSATLARHLLERLVVPWMGAAEKAKEEAHG